MRTFEIRSDKFNGAVVVKFDTDDQFCAIDFSKSRVNRPQMEWFLKQLPKTAADLKCYQGVNITEVLESVDFDAFWNKYNDKARSSKVKTKNVWDRIA